MTREREELPPPSSRFARSNSCHLPQLREEKVISGKPQEWFDILDTSYVIGASKAWLEGEFSRYRRPRTAPLAWLVVRGKHERVRGLLDTGVSINLISEGALAKFPHTRMSEYHVHLIGIVGEPTKLNERYDMEMILHNGTSIEVPILCGLDEQIGLILGMPFLE